MPQAACPAACLPARLQQILSDLGWAPPMNINDPSSVCEWCLPKLCSLRAAWLKLGSALMVQRRSLKTPFLASSQTLPPLTPLTPPSPSPSPSAFRPDTRMFSMAKGQAIITLMGTFPGYFFTVGAGWRQKGLPLELLVEGADQGIHVWESECFPPHMRCAAFVEKMGRVTIQYMVSWVFLHTLFTLLPVPRMMHYM